MLKEKNVVGRCKAGQFSLTKTKTKTRGNLSRNKNEGEWRRGLRLGPIFAKRKVGAQEITGGFKRASGEGGP